MLSTISVEDVADTRTRFGMGAVLPSAVWTPRPNGAGAAIAARPRLAAAGVIGQQQAQQMYQHTTRIAAPSGGRTGPQSARDPV